ncbi:MAG: exonuclease SbcCD subunit D [Clostridiales bacterium]|nr:exonuclease SbcCD subunit D [Clostridiales bacterium]
MNSPHIAKKESSMKFLHISDLHLGKQLSDLSLLVDQEYILDQIVSIADEQKADAVLIAGDVYQRSAPQAEAMALFDRFVTSLVSIGKKVFIISGNHDSALRVSYFSSLVRNSGVFITEAFDGRLQSVSLQDEHGEIILWMLPFLRPSQVRRTLPGEKISTYQDAVAAVLRNTPIDPTKRNLLMCHQFITGCETSDSEELAVGGLDNIDASLFEAFDYVALGHIHKPQRVGRDTLRYAGSPLKYSFSEHNHRKSVALVTLQEKGTIEVSALPLYPLRDLRLVEGSLAEIAAMPYSEDYVWITIHDELPPPDARITLSINFPNMLKFSVVNSRTKYDVNVLATQRMEDKSVPELFEDFYRLQNNDQPPSEEHKKLLEKVLSDLEENRS